MRTHLKKLTMIAAIAAMATLLLAGCNFLNLGSGTVTLNMTDAPVDGGNIAGVYLSISEIQYNQSSPDGEDDGEWVTVPDFEPTEPFNLLDLTGGQFKALGDLTFDAGTLYQIRFILEDVDERGAGRPTNPGSYVELSDGTKEALFVPSGAQTGYKAVTEDGIAIPRNETITLTADFDVRKALVNAGGDYLLKPTIRLIADSEAGTIAGTLSNMDTNAHQYTVYVYEDGSYDSSEAADPSSDTEVRFPNAVSSYTVKADSASSGDYALAYLAAGDYDLYVAKFNPDGDNDGQPDYVGVDAGPADRTVSAGQDTTADIDVGALSFQ